MVNALVTMGAFARFVQGATKHLNCFRNSRDYWKSLEGFRTCRTALLYDITADEIFRTALFKVAEIAFKNS